MSEIIKFFNNKHILITGATGFIGKLLVEEILRKCEPNKIYLLIRSKNNADAVTRIEKLFQDTVFEKLKIEKPNFIDKVEVVVGDFCEKDLALDNNMRKTLVENVEIVLHNGANTKLNQSLKVATKMNICGTLSLVNLCLAMKQLKAFVYVSSVFAAYLQPDIEEKFYPSPVSYQEVIHAVETFTDDELNAFEEKYIINTWISGYPFSKMISENLIQNHAASLPAVVVRPAIIACSMEEPKPGWIDGLSSISALQMSIQMGTNSVFRFNKRCLALLVPADMTVSCIIAAAYQASILRISDNKELGIQVYNVSPSPDNILTWKDLVNSWVDINRNFPHDHMYWITNSVYSIQMPYLFDFISFIRDGIPAILMDIALLAMNKSNSVFKTYRKCLKYTIAASHFITKYNNVQTQNTESLWRSLNEIDRKLFNFNMKSIDWTEYLISTHKSIIHNILKDNQEKCCLATRKRFNRLRLLQTILSYFLYTTIGFTIWNILF